MSPIDQLIRQFNLRPHPEGGWYIQIYKCNEQIVAEALPKRVGGNRAFWGHHDPSHSDAFLNAMFSSFKKNAGNIPQADLAKEGLEIDL